VEREDLPNYFNDVSSNFLILDDFYDFEKLSFLQIGVYASDASEYLLKHYSHLTGFQLTDVDTWSRGDSQEMQGIDFEKVYSMYLQRFSGEIKKERLIVRKSTSDYFFSTNKEFFDFIYVDGNHEPKQVIKDAINSFDCLKSGGILAFDDYLGAEHLNEHLRPKFAIDFFKELFEGKLIVLKSNYQIWFQKI
jgi:hypothetical protein